MYAFGKNTRTNPGVISDFPDESGGRKCGDTAVTKNVSAEKLQLCDIPFVAMKVPRRASRSSTDGTEIPLREESILSILQYPANATSERDATEVFGQEEAEKQPSK
jgi:hypothetical protein